MNSPQKNNNWAVSLNRFIKKLPTNRFYAYEILGIPSLIFVIYFIFYEILIEEQPLQGYELAIATIFLILLWPILYATIISILLEPDSQIESLWEGIFIYGYFLIQTILFSFGYLVYFRKIKEIRQYKLQRMDYQNNMKNLEVKLTNGFYAGALELLRDIKIDNGAVLTHDEKNYLINKIEELEKYNFPSRSDSETANSAGFDNFDEWTTAKSKGFSDNETYQKSLKGGFNDYNEYSRMIHLGFKTKEAYLSAKLEDDRNDIERAYSEIMEVFAPPIHLLRIAEKLNKSLEYIYETTLLLIERKLLLGKIHTGSSIESKDYLLKLTHLENRPLETSIKATETNNAPIVDVLQTCPECGNTQSIIARTCTACGNELPFCNLCKRGFGEKEITVSCEECKNLFHRQHLQAFVQSKGECPICKTKMTITQFDL